jgi:hypothetical protein
MWFDLILKKDRFSRQGNNRTYHVLPIVWSEAGLEYHDGMPTIEELEKLLKRKLTKRDFILGSTLNWKYAHLQPDVEDRLGRDGIIEGIKERLTVAYGFMDDNTERWEIEEIKQELIDAAKRWGTSIDNELEIFDKRIKRMERSRIERGSIRDNGSKRGE